MSRTQQMHVAITQATVGNAWAVQRILKRYHTWLPLEVVAEGKGGAGRLTLEWRYGPPEDWPTALRIEELPPEDAFEDEESWYKAGWALHETPRGEEGLAAMLLEIAPHLTSPLTLQAAHFDIAVGGFVRAKEWSVRRGAAEVEIKEMVALEEE